MNGYRWSPFLIDCGGPYLSIDAYTTTHSISCSSKAGVPGESDSIHLTDLFFFQAEDGIRDQPRSRGLGDVYKRQVLDR